MRKLISAVLVLAISLAPTGCGVSGSIDINNDNGDTNVTVILKVHKHKPIKDGTKNDLITYASQNNVDLTDVPTGLSQSGFYATSRRDYYH